MPSPLNGRIRERRFVRAMAAQGIQVAPNRRVFRFGLTTYRPDFVNGETYYEVIGTRQRYAALRPIFDLMRHVYPQVQLSVVTPEGTPYSARPAWRRGHLAVLVGSALLERGMKVKELSALAGLSSANISACLRGKPGYRTMAARLQAWVETGAMPPRPPTYLERLDARDRTLRAVRRRVKALIRQQRFTRSAIARHLGVSPQQLNDALHGRTGRRVMSPGLLPRVLALVEAPEVPALLREDRRVTRASGAAP